MPEINDMPYIDSRVDHVGITKLRELNAKGLRDMNKLLVLQDNNQPLAVLVKYEQYLVMQQKLQSLMNTIRMSNQDDLNQLKKGRRHAFKNHAVKRESTEKG